MSGVEIEFSVERDDSGTQDVDGRGTEAEAGDTGTQASTTTGRPSRIQG